MFIGVFHSDCLRFQPAENPVFGRLKQNAPNLEGDSLILADSGPLIGDLSACNRQGDSHIAQILRRRGLYIAIE